MTTEWRELKTLQEVAAAQAAGEEIEVLNIAADEWTPWLELGWGSLNKYRSRPKQPKIKKIVLREALMYNPNTKYHWTQWYSDRPQGGFFVCWLDTPAREIEVPE